MERDLILPFITHITTINRISWIYKEGWSKVIVLITFIYLSLVAAKTEVSFIRCLFPVISGMQFIIFLVWMDNCCILLLPNVEFEKLDPVLQTVAKPTIRTFQLPRCPLARDLDVRGLGYRGQLCGTVQKLSSTKVQQTCFWFPQSLPNKQRAANLFNVMCTFFCFFL